MGRVQDPQTGLRRLRLRGRSPSDVEAVGVQHGDLAGLDGAPLDVVDLECRQPPVRIVLRVARRQRLLELDHAPEDDGVRPARVVAQAIGLDLLLEVGEHSGLARLHGPREVGLDLVDREAPQLGDRDALPERQALGEEGGRVPHGGWLPVGDAHHRCPIVDGDAGHGGGGEMLDRPHETEWRLPKESDDRFVGHGIASSRLYGSVAHGFSAGERTKSIEVSAPP